MRRGPFYELFGQQLTLSEMAELADVQASTMHHRLKRMSPIESIVKSVPPRHADLSGQTFSRLTVLEPRGVSPSNKPMWLCLCACGEEKIVIGADLKSGRTTSCGCLRREVVIKTRISESEDLTGRSFADGALEVLGVSENWAMTKASGRTKRVRLWRCLCPCGDAFDAKASQLHRGQVTSCGCGYVWKQRSADAAAKHARRFDVLGASLSLKEIEQVFGIAPETFAWRMAHGADAIEAISKPVKPASKGSKRCGKCGGQGHNRVKCRSVEAGNAAR